MLARLCDKKKESLECDKEMKINHIYSRRWTKNGKIVDKREAEIFSMLCVVPKTDVKKWLVKSGVSRQPVFTTTKRNGDEVILTESFGQGNV